jgi:hypothetical protein
MKKTMINRLALLALTTLLATSLHAAKHLMANQ